MTSDTQADCTTSYHLTSTNDGDGFVIAICDPDGRCLAEVRCEEDPSHDNAFHTVMDANFIVHRLNTFETLLKACERTLRNLELMLEMDDPQACTQMEWDAEPLATLRKAIAEAEDYP